MPFELPHSFALLMIVLVIAAAKDTPFHESQFGLTKPKKPGFQPNIVFLIMAFNGRGMQAAYKALKDECTKLLLVPLRADETTGSGSIIRDVYNLIAKAEFIICDLTYERPNVYYELALAHEMGNNVLLIAREGTMLHCDIALLRVHFYRSPEHLRSIISHQLKSMIRLSRDRMSH